jgi:hypothetical protein
MITTVQLTGPHRRTYDAIFQAENALLPGWREVQALLGQLGKVTEEPDGSLKITRNGQILVLPSPRPKEVAKPDELLALRHFLERSETVPPGTAQKAAQWLVVIDHREARIYRSVVAGAVPQQIRPHVAQDFFQTSNPARDSARSPGKTDPGNFYEPVAGVLNGAGEILVFGCGTGKSSEMDQFTAWLKAHRPALADRIIGSRVVDEHHLTEGQLLAKARAIYANVRVGQVGVSC